MSFVSARDFLVSDDKFPTCSRIMDLVRALTLQTLKYNFYFKALHVPGHYNDIADSISRFQQTRFRRLAPISIFFFSISIYSNNNNINTSNNKTRPLIATKLVEADLSIQ